MTLDEAKALVLHEGLAGEQSSEDAAFILLHSGDDPGLERMSGLLTAMKMICEAMEGAAQMDRPLAAALYTLGTMAKDCLDAHERYGRAWRDGAEYEVTDLIEAVESVFYSI